MSMVMESPHLIEEGVAFTVAVGFMKRDCLIPKQTLSYICRTWGDDMDYLEAFHAYEDTIIAVARRMAIAGSPSSPIILERKFFPW
ncbi:MAG TPA: hypothetical protein VEC06_21320 [Paucimonas sp.]|nr:hypothetical protein [Paucimonas sp.]